MKDLFFIRHGQTEWNAERRMQGQLNSDLTSLGKKQAETHGKFLAACDIEYLVASPLDRTRQTASIINQHLALDIIYDKRIMEWDCGDWSGQIWGELAENWPREFSNWRADPYYYRGPNCENYPDMIERTKPFLEDLRQIPQQRIAIVSHGLIGRVMVSFLLNLGPEEAITLTQPNDTIFQLKGQDDGYASCHFISGEGPINGLPRSLV